MITLIIVKNMNSRWRYCQLRSNFAIYKVFPPVFKTDNFLVTSMEKSEKGG